MPIKKIEGALQRELKAEIRNLDADERRVELAFSSETPYERWWGIETLGHREGEAQFERLNNSAPLLADHNNSVRDQIGVVEEARVDAGNIGRAVVRFSKRADADAVYNDVLDGIVSKVSVGYRIDELVLERIEDGKEYYRATRWTPHEISLVAAAADDTVGVGRTEQQQEVKVIMSDDNNAVETPAAVEPVVVDEIDTKREREENQMRQVGAHFKQQQLAEDYIFLGKSLGELRDEIWKQKASEIKPVPKTHLDLTPKEQQRYSLIRAIRAAVSKDWSKAEFELKCSQEIAERLGKEARGFFVPFDIQNRAPDLNVTTGAALVGTDHLSSAFIDLLRANTVVIAAGATMLPGLVGNVDIPKQTGGATFYWLADDGDVPDSDSAYGSVTLSPKTVAGSTPMSRRLLKQSAPAIEQLVQNDLVQGAARAIDLAAMEGTGVAEQPTGIVNQGDVLTQTVADVGNIPTFAEAVGFETQVNSADALIGSPTYVTTPSVLGGLKTTPKDAGSGIMLVENMMLNGYPVATSTQLTAGRIIFGSYSQLLIGMWGILDINPDPYAKAAAGGLVIRVFQDIDIAVRHGQAFCIDA